MLSYPFVAPSRHDDLGLPADDPRRTALRLVNPISDEQPLLRTSLLATLVDVARRNLSRGVRDLALFEIGRVYRPAGDLAAVAALPRAVRPSDAELAALEAGVPPQPRRVAVLLAGQRERAGWWGPGRAVDWTDAVGAAQTLAQALGVRLGVEADDHAPWHPGRCARLTLPDGTLVGHAGELHPRVAATLELPARTCVAELDLDALVAAAPAQVPAASLSTHPVALRDVALVVDDAVPAVRVEAALRDGGGPLLESVRLFDEYVGEQVGAGRRSLAYRLTLRADDRTLTGEEADAARDQAVAAASADTGAHLRTA